MKKILALLTIAAIIVGLTACRKDKTSGGSLNKNVSGVVDSGYAVSTDGHEHTDNTSSTNSDSESTVADTSSNIKDASSKTESTTSKNTAIQVRPSPNPV